MRNKVCFEGKKLHNPIEIICRACALMKLWAGLQKDRDKEMLVRGVDAMIKIALQLLSKKQQVMIRPNMLLDLARDEDEEQEPEQ